jgi:hypothetical protein
MRNTFGFMVYRHIKIEDYVLNRKGRKFLPGKSQKRQGRSLRRFDKDDSVCRTVNDYSSQLSSLKRQT